MIQCRCKCTSESGYVRAGLSFYKAHVDKDLKQPQEEQFHLQDYLARVPRALHPGDLP